MNRKLAAITAIVLSTVALVACASDGDSKYSTYNNDAATAQGNREAAEVGRMPDGYSNYATKCDRPGIRIYVIYHGDSPYGSIAPIADPTCK